MNEAPHFYAKDRATWREWLVDNHETEKAVWLVYDKGSERKLKWQDIVQEALCFGWIDGRQNVVSETQSKIYVSKRKPKGMWSKINKANVEELIASRQMQSAGLAAVERAKLNGSWDTLNNSDNLILPPELINAFKENPLARANFEAFPESSRRNALQWMYDAKTDATRQKRIKQTVESAAQNVRVR